MRLHVTALIALLPAVLIAGCATSPRKSDAGLEIHVAQSTLDSTLIKKTDPSDGYPIYVDPNPVITGKDVVAARVVLVRRRPPPDDSDKDRDSSAAGKVRPGVAFQLSWWAARRLSSEIKKHTVIERSPAGHRFKRYPRLVIMFDGKILCVTPAKRKIRREMMVSGSFTKAEAEELAAALSSEPLSRRRKKDGW